MTQKRLGLLVAALTFVAFGLTFSGGCSSDDPTPVDAAVAPKDASTPAKDVGVDASVVADIGPKADVGVDVGPKVCIEVEPDAGTVVTPDAGSTAVDAGPFTPPSGNVPVTFEIDDSINKSYVAGELQWKGSFTFDPADRTLVKSSGWCGSAAVPCVPLYDDGPYTEGGHEGVGAMAGDHKWGIAVFVAPGVEDIVFEYGAQTSGGSWVWNDPAGNAKVTVPKEGSETPIAAKGMAFPAFGTTDLKLVVDPAAVNSAHFACNVTVKGAAWGWNEIRLKKGDDGFYTFELGKVLSQLRNTGLLSTGAKPEWVFVFGGTEYKVASKASMEGVKAYTKVKDATTWTEMTIALCGNNNNTCITAP